MRSLKLNNKRNGRIRSILALAVVISVVFGACQGKHIIYRERAEIGGEGWTATDTLRFAFPVSDTSKTYDIALEVEHGREYAWQNLYVRIFTGFTGDSLKTDILSLEFSNGSGAWAGHCSGDRCKLDIPLQSRVRFPAPGNYSLTFEQYMRQEVVPDVYSLQLTVRESQPLTR